MVWAGRDLTDNPVPPPCHEQGPLPPAQAAPSPVQPGLEPCQGGGSHRFSGQPGPGPHHPQGEEFLPNISSKSALSQFKAITPCPVTPCPCPSPSPALSQPLQALAAAPRSPRSLLLPRLSSPSSPSLSSQQRGSSPWVIAGASSGPAPTAPALSCAEESMWKEVILPLNPVLCVSYSVTKMDFHDSGKVAVNFHIVIIFFAF